MTGTIYVSQRRGDGRWIAEVAELPGCIGTGPSRDEAVAAVRQHFDDYRSMLEERGATNHWKSMDSATLAVKDPPAPILYDEDFRPLEEEHELRDFVHQLEASRASLLATIAPLDAAQLEKHPGKDMWSVRQAVEHLMTAQLSILAKLEKWPAGDFASLNESHRLVVQRVSALTPKEFAIDHVIDGACWSTRRVLRRILAHHEEHHAHIKEIIAALER